MFTKLFQITLPCLGIAVNLFEPSCLVLSSCFFASATVPAAALGPRSNSATSLLLVKTISFFSGKLDQAAKYETFCYYTPRSHTGFNEDDKVTYCY